MPSAMCPDCQRIQWLYRMKNWMYCCICSKPIREATGADYND